MTVADERVGQQTPPRGQRLFLCYRRADTSGHAGRLYDRLSERFGDANVFMDVTGIEPGADFVDRIHAVLRDCAAAVVLIGPNWVGRTGDGRRRIDDEADFVRLEVEGALSQGLGILPVLVRGAEMPTEAELPPPLRPLARRNALELDDQRWDYDVGRLISAIEPVVVAPRTAWKVRGLRSPVALAAVLAVVAASVTGALLLRGSGAEWEELEFAAGEGSLDVPPAWSDIENVRWLGGPVGPQELTFGHYFTASTDVDLLNTQYHTGQGAIVRYSPSEFAEYYEVDENPRSRDGALERHLTDLSATCRSLAIVETEDDDAYTVRRDWACEGAETHVAQVARIGHDQPTTTIVDVVGADRDVVERVLRSVRIGGQPLTLGGSARGPLVAFDPARDDGEDADGEQEDDLAPAQIIEHEEVPMSIRVPEVWDGILRVNDDDDPENDGFGPSLFVSPDLDGALPSAEDGGVDVPSVFVGFSRTLLESQGVDASSPIEVAQWIAEIDSTGGRCSYTGVSLVGVDDLYGLSRTWTGCGDHAGTVVDAFVVDPAEGWVLTAKVVLPGGDHIDTGRAILETVRYDDRQLARF